MGSASYASASSRPPPKTRFYRKTPYAGGYYRGTELFESMMDVPDVPEAPTFRPTVEQFRDPIAYLKSIYSEASKSGIIKIIPPANAPDWPPRFAARTSVPFPTRVQKLHLLIKRSAAAEQVKKDVIRADALRSQPKERSSVARAEAAGSSTASVSPMVSPSAIALAAVAAAKASGATGLPTGNGVRPTREHKARVVASLSHDEQRMIDAAMRESLAEGKRAARRQRTDSDGDSDDEQQQQQQQQGDASHDVKPLVGGAADSAPLFRGASDRSGRMGGSGSRMSQGKTDGFGFEIGDQYTLSEFEVRAAAFKCEWFGVGPRKTSDLLAMQTALSAIRPEEVESEFWRVLVSGEDQVAVEYGADIDSGRYGSGFPASCRSPWSLRNLPTATGSLLGLLPESIAGVTYPWLYMGQLFGCFCWHAEDNYLFSIAYSHCGDYKTWYGLPGSHVVQFEALLHQTFPDLAASSPGFIYDIVTMLPPSIVQAAGIPIVRARQAPGEFIVTFPGAYHSGFSHGFNLTEAGNFSLLDWLPSGALAIERYRTVRTKAPCFCHDQLLMTLAANLIARHSRGGGPATAVAEGVTLHALTVTDWVLLLNGFRRMVTSQVKEREILTKASLLPSRRVAAATADADSACDCGSCKYLCYLAWISCRCGQAVRCLRCFARPYSLTCGRCGGGHANAVYHCRYTPEYAQQVLGALLRIATAETGSQFGVVEEVPQNEDGSDGSAGAEAGAAAAGAVATAGAAAAGAAGTKAAAKQRPRQQLPTPSLSIRLPVLREGSEVDWSKARLRVAPPPPVVPVGAAAMVEGGGAVAGFKRPRDDLDADDGPDRKRSA